MQDLIERQAALNCFHDWIDRHGDVHTADEMQEYNAIEALPSAQPEIIRCKDCKYSKHWYWDKRRCFLWSEDGICVLKDGFCNYADRRQDE